jgi:hypothetical protein
MLEFLFAAILPVE